MSRLKQEIIDAITIEQTEKLLKSTMYLFGIDEISCLLNAYSDDEIAAIPADKIDSVEELMELIDIGFTPCPF